LEDAQTLVTHARQAGVVEDIVRIFNITKSKIILFFLVSHHLLVQHRQVMKIINLEEVMAII
jgi:hypothetical protein